jgi:Pyridoxamine 5'-phosphate oxidase
MDPTAEPIDLPQGYGTATQVMEWGAVPERLEQAPRYWLVTLRRDGRPHVVPVDGLWLDDAWWYGAARPPSTSATWSATSGSWSTSRTPWPR